MSIDPEIHTKFALFASLSTKNFGKIKMHPLVVLFYAAGGVGQLLDNFPAKNFRISKYYIKLGVFLVPGT
jgi:hypothetical protein